MFIKKYIVTAPRHVSGELKADINEVVYDCVLSDFGGADDDTRLLGYPHTSVTHDPNGGYPYFTIPTSDIQEIH